MFSGTSVYVEHIDTIIVLHIPESVYLVVLSSYLFKLQMQHNFP